MVTSNIQAQAPPAASFPVDARVAGGSGELHANLFAPGVKVIVRNTTTLAAQQGEAMPLQAVVLRGVRWVGTSADATRWRVNPLAIVQEGADGSIRLVAQPARKTAVTFETGLLLPGEEMEIALPLTPQRDGRHEIALEFAVVAPGKDWATDVLLPRDPSASQLEFAAPTEQARAKRKPGSLAFVRSTSRQGPAVGLQKITIPFALKLTEDPTNQATGGLSYVEAARRAGLDASEAGLLGFYRPALAAWFFTRGDGSAAALVKEAKPKAPKADPWTPRAMPRMSSTAPELFDGQTLIDAHVEGFSNLAGVVPPAELWRALERAEKGKLEIRRVEATDADGRPAPKLELVSPR
jgi:hypothetical protein